MGVPKFFRWVTEKYPQINRRINEGRRVEDYTDNFYLDMNGIIHGCTHGSESKKGASEEEQIERILGYTERLIRIAKPRKLVYLAIDGVAPRAKMNQQRSRRYRKPREAAQQAAAEAAKAAALGQRPPPPPGPDAFDSNCITPGTAFLQGLGERYKAWIAEKMASDPDWQRGPRIVFSGADVAGEGEHKIMDAIRAGRASGEMDDETRHCMYGLDADLIMLGLVTHTPKFSLLRERQKFQRGKFAPRGKRGPATIRDPSGIRDREEVSSEAADERDFAFLEVELLRAAIAATLRPDAEYASTADSRFDGERIVDDFVFMCMLVGNDFIPGLPSLDVKDGALDFMLRTYTENVHEMGYLTDKGTLNLPALEQFVGHVAAREPRVFEKKAAGSQARRSYQRDRVRYQPPTDPLEYKRKYDLEKLGLPPGAREGKLSLVQSYLEGLEWCLKYYHDGCASWDWFYPDFYAPLPSDLTNLTSYEINFSLGKPFPPLAQLLAVLPPQSAQLVPRPYQDLMLSPTSPVAEAYPIDFVLDLNGKKEEWMAIALLPFIDETRLLPAIAALDDQLTEEERLRNVVGQDMVYDPTMERATQAREAPRRTVSREGTAPRKKRAANADDSATNARKKTSTLGGGTEARQRSGAKRRVSKSDEVQ